MFSTTTEISKLSGFCVFICTDVLSTETIKMTKMDLFSFCVLLFLFSIFMPLSVLSFCYVLSGELSTFLEQNGQSGGAF